MNLTEGNWKAIGIIRTPHKTQEGTPIQPNKAEDYNGYIELAEDYAEGLQDLDGFEYIHLIYWFDRAGPARMKVTPFLDDVERGLFATRAPRRPNPIGLSTVKLLRVEGNRVYVDHVDMLDGTPLLDIKPYVPSFESHPDARQGWINEMRVQREAGRADDRFTR